MNDFEQILLNHIKRYPGLGTWNMVKALDAPRSKVEWGLNNLFREGKIRWEFVPHPGPGHTKRVWFCED